jgi:LPS-assembly lipoprotein
VPQIPERAGQRLTIALRDAFNPSGVAVDPRYRLHVTLTTTRRDTAIRQDGTATRAEVAVTAGYRLVALENGRTALSGTARSSSSVDLVVNEYANVVAEEDARMRAVDEVAVELQTRCAMFMGRPAEAAK